ncbi:MAG TPA: sucrase ferredoxin [Acidimicrobiales bacterium]|nr:sucrase ferredoxin [Acidimicrobiales bacterium]
MADAPRCAFLSRDRDEALHGTASRVQRWLVVEQPGPWGREAVVESRLPAEVGHVLRSMARRLGVRVLLVRRPGWRRGATRRVYVARTAPDRQWIEQLDLADPRELLDLDLHAVAADDPPGLGEPGPSSVHLVCTHGRHDACCADLGRPVVRALDDAGVAEVWESSHLGGDRFAANLVCLPTGTYYGRVAPESAAALVRGHEAGVIDLEHYRGRSCLPPLVQSAEIFARRHLDEVRIDGLTVTGVTGGAGSAEVCLAGADGRRIIVQVVRERAESAVLTCSAVGQGQAWRYRLVDITDG